MREDSPHAADARAKAFGAASGATDTHASRDVTAARAAAQESKAVKPGTFDQRVLLQRRVETRTSIGAVVTTYVDVGYLWAAVEPLSGRELFNAQQTQSEITTRIRVHWQRGITELMRIVHTRSYESPQLLDIFDIVSVLDMKSQHTEMHLFCIRRASEQGLSIPPSTITADMDSITADNG